MFVGGEKEDQVDQYQESVTESEEDLLSHFVSCSPLSSDSPDSAYGSLSLSETDSLESQPHSPAKVPGEESLSDQGSDSGVSDLSASFREPSPQPRIGQRHKAQTRGRHRKQQIRRDTVTPAT